MKEKSCYLCDEVLTDTNRTIEHILLNAIGGKLKSKDLICRTCNSDFGNAADKELAKQFAFLSNFFEVKRDRGRHPPINAFTQHKGKTYRLDENLNPVLAKPHIFKDEDGKNMSITAKDERQLMEVLNGLKRSNPALDIELAKEKFKASEEYISETYNINMETGGEPAFKSIVKTAINFYLIRNGEIQFVEHIFPYLKGEAEMKITKHFILPDHPYNQTESEIIHLIHLVGNKTSRLLYCYIELFSSYSFLVTLSLDYKGEDLAETYCYDVRSAQTISKSISLSVNREELEDDKRFNTTDFATITARLNRIMRMGEAVRVDRQITKIIEKTFDRIVGSKPFTEELRDKVIWEVATQYTKFVNSRIKRNHSDEFLDESEH